jgi:hypothetical protein
MKEEYRVPLARLRAGERYRIEVDALGPEGETLGGAEALEFQVPGDGGGAGFAGSPGGAEITAIEPAAGSVATSARPVIGASWSAPLAVREVLLFVDGVEVSGLSELDALSIRHRPLAPLEPGEHAVELQLAGRTSGWRFTVAPPADGAVEPEPDGAARFLDGRANAELSASAAGGDEPRDTERARLALSGQIGARQPAAAFQATADLSWNRALVGGASTDQESENWLARTEGRSGPAAAELAAGYGAPTFLAESEFLAAGLARGGTEGAFGSPGRGRVAYYRSFDPELGNVAGGGFAVDQDLRAAGLELGGEGRGFVLRALGLEVEQEATPFDAGGAGRSFGLFGRFRMGRGVDLVLEAARGKFTPGAGSLAEEREGDAYRLGIAGSVGSLDLAVDLRHIDQGFVNPANQGLGPGGRSDRDVLEISLAKGFARSRLEARLQHVDGGDGFGPPAMVDAARLDYWASPGPTLSLALGGNVAVTRAEADAELFLPETDRRDWGLSASLTATLGGLQLTPTASLQRQEDAHDAAARVTTTGLGLSAFATGPGALTLSAALNGTRVEGGPLGGRTDSLALSLQPAWEIAAAALRLQPLVSYTETANDLLGLDTTSERYLMTVAWNPRWLGSLLGLELSGDWSRTRGGPGAGDDFFARYTATLVLRRLGEALRPRPASPSGGGGAMDRNATSTPEGVARRSQNT